MLKQINKAIRSDKGFTLVELSIVMIVGGLLLAASARGLKSKVVQQKIDQQDEVIDSVTTALAEYIRDDRTFDVVSGNLVDEIAFDDGDPLTSWDDSSQDEVHWPCPADPQLSPGDPLFGVESRNPGNPAVDTGIECRVTGGIQMIDTGAEAVFVGAVPVVTLGLPAAKAIDAYGNKLTYAISGEYAKSQALDVSAGTLTPQINIQTYEADGTETTVEDQAVYALFSHGPDGAGAYGANSDDFNDCNDNALDGQNCSYQDNTIVTNDPETAKTFVDSSLAYSEADGANRLDDTAVFSLAAVNDSNNTGYWKEADNAAANITHKNSGFVGIGEASPTEQLHVTGNTLLNGDADITGNADINGNAIIDGRVGIGTDSPARKLHVDDGALQVSGASSGISIAPRDDSGSRFEWYNPNGSDLRLWTDNNGSGGFGDLLSVERNGNIGIGNTTPNYKLDVSGDLVANNLRIRRSDGAENSMAIGSSNNVNSEMQFFNGSGGGEFTWRLNENASTYEAMRLARYGRLGIGVTNPVTKLHVNGGIRAKKGAPSAADASDEGYAFGTDGDTGMFVTNDPDGGASGGDITFFVDGRRALNVAHSSGVLTTKSNVVIGQEANASYNYGPALVFEGGRDFGFGSNNSDLFFMRRQNNSADSSELQMYLGDNYGHNSASSDSFRIFATAGSTTGELFNVNSSGAVGIMIEDPITTLDVNGEVKLGNTGVSCNSTREGALRYDNPNNFVQYCDGSAWTNLSAGIGPQGPKGDDGTDGRDGADGADGADGLGLTAGTCTTGRVMNGINSNGTASCIAAPTGSTGADCTSGTIAYVSGGRWREKDIGSGTAREQITSRVTHGQYYFSNLRPNILGNPAVVNTAPVSATITGPVSNWWEAFYANPSESRSEISPGAGFNSCYAKAHQYRCLDGVRRLVSTNVCVDGAIPDGPDPHGGPTGDD